MHTKTTRALGLLLTGLMLLTFLGMTPAPTNSAVKTVEVASVDELVAAIGSSTAIVLLPGEYDLSSAATDRSEVRCHPRLQRIICKDGGQGAAAAGEGRQGRADERLHLCGVRGAAAVREVAHHSRYGEVHRLVLPSRSILRLLDVIHFYLQAL